MRPTWHEYYMHIATVVASRSTCLRVPTGVGSVLVSKHNQIISTGYAGSLPGQPHCVDVGCLPGPSGGCIRTVHSEINALAQAAQHGGHSHGATLYCTMSPCWDCMKALLSAGISAVFYHTQYRTIDLQKEAALKARVLLTHTSDDVYTGAPK